MTIKHLERKLNFKILISIITALTIVAIVSANTESANADVIIIPSSLGGSASVTFNTVGLGSEFDGQLISQFNINWHTGGEGNITVPGGTIDDVKARSMFEGTFFSPIASSSPNTRYILQSVTGSSPITWWGPKVTNSPWSLYVKSNTENVISH